MINAKIAGMLVAAFVAGSFVASPELRAYAANTVFSTDIVDGQVKTADLGSNSVTSAKIADGTITAADLATDSVGSSEIIPNSVGAVELKEVSKLLFSECVLSSADANANVTHGLAILKTCNISGVDSDDFAVATFTKGSPCFAVTLADTQNGSVNVVLRNAFTSGCALKAGDSIAVMVYDK
jgi:hypothetical protein